MYELTLDERVELAEHVVRRVGGRVPVIAAGAFGDSCESQAESAKRIAGGGGRIAVWRKFDNFNHDNAIAAGGHAENQIPDKNGVTGNPVTDSGEM